MLKWTVTITLITILSFLHIQGSGTELEGHLLHQQLFFIPIILASFWFHLRAGISIAVLISIIYFSTMQIHMTNPDIRITLISQISLYLFVAALIGWLTTRLDKQQKQAIKNEKSRAMVRLVSALNHEISEIVNALETQFRKTSKVLEDDSLLDFQSEINKLKQLTKAFERFDIPEEKEAITQDINEVLKKSQRKLQSKANLKKIDIISELDETGCPTMLLNDAIIQTIDALIDNAIEASPEHSKIIVRSKRKGTYCLVEVTDSGHGVNETDVPRLFTPFFTTKPDGHGLSLAAGKKMLKDCEGDLMYERAIDGGSIFKLILPRENTVTNINGHIAERI